MALKTTSLQIVFGLILTIFGSQCHMAPASTSVGTFKQFDVGTHSRYKYTSVVLLKEPGGKGKDVGYQITADVHVNVVWQNVEDKNSRLLQFEVKNPQLHIKSRKAPAPEGFVQHKSDLDKINGGAFLAHWINGKIEVVYISTSDKHQISLNNVRRGIISLFQFQLIDTKTKELDTSGECDVMYHTTNPHKFVKTKTDCVSSSDVTFLKHPHPVLTTNVMSTRTTKYNLSRDLSLLETVLSDETHELFVSLKPDAGGSVTATQELILTDSNSQAATLQSTTLDDALKEWGQLFKISQLDKTNLRTEMYKSECDKDECSLPKLIKESRQYLTADNLGSVKSASVFIKLLNVAREASKEELTKAFKGTKNREILSQLCDLAGAVQNVDAHNVIMKLINFDSDEYQDESERYLWALSQGSHPHEDVIRDVLKISEKPHSNEKITETLLLTVAAMVNKFEKVAENRNNHKLVKQVTESLTNGLVICKDEKCKCQHLRALKNLKNPTVIPLLIKNALEGTKKVSVLSLTALKSFDPLYWNDDVIDAAQRVYYQAGKRFDSSARTLAIDILLEAKPRREIMEELVLTVFQHDRVYEVKQYLNQRIEQKAEDDLEFLKLLTGLYDKHGEVFNHYHAKAVRGMSTAFTRVFANNTHSRGSLISIQEISNGLLKRGVVDVVVETNEASFSLFTLGLFAGGLDSFMSSKSDDDADNNEVEQESATAGMDVTVGGVQIRPFVFFDGQTELMGHVWSGTASEKTPAYQSFVLLQDHLEYIPLQNGVVSKLLVNGVASVDLSAQIQMSLWNRNAHTLVEKNAGVALQGKIQADTSFVKSQVEFNVGTEGKLHIVSDVNFSGDIAICMQVSQPLTFVKHNIHKIERIPGSKHRLRKSKYKSVFVPGRSYVLNKKNNEMCDKLLSDS